MAAGRGFSALGHVRKAALDLNEASCPSPPRFYCEEMIRVDLEASDGTDQTGAQAAKPNSLPMNRARAAASGFATRLTRAVRIMLTAWMPCSVRQALWNEA